MKAILSFLFCLILSWHLSAGSSAPAINSDTRQTAQQLLDLSFTQNLSNHELAIQTAQNALALFQSINDREGIANSYLAIGRFNYALDKMDEAAKNDQLSLEIWRELNDTVGEAQMLTQLGYIEGRRGDWLKGFSYLTQAQALLNDPDAVGPMAGIASGMGYFFNESGLPENGLIQYQRARDYYLKVPKGEGSYNRQVMNIGYTYFLLDDYEAASRNLQQALEYFKSVDGAELNTAECEEHIGQVYLAKDQYDLALQSWLPIPAVYESAGNHSDAAQVRALIGEAYQRLGKIELARTNYEAALKVFRAGDDPVRKAAVAFALGRLELNQNNYDSAEKYLKESIETTEDIRSGLSSRMLATAFSASVHDRYETYIECLMRKHKEQPGRGLELQAFEASELARARSLAALLRDTQTKIVTGIDQDLVEKENRLRREIHNTGDQIISLLATDYKTEQLIKIEKSLADLRQQHQKLTRQLQKQNPHYDQIKETTNYSVQQIQQVIVEDNETMLLEYFLGENASYAWAITRNEVRVYKLPKADVITEAVKVVYDLLAKQPDDNTDKSLNKASGELAQLVLTPLANQPNVKRVIVVADGALNYIPFQLLPAPSGNQVLVASYEVVNAPSASILGQLHQEKLQRPATTKILAAFGDPVFRSNYALFKNSASDESVAKATERDFEMDSDSRDPSKIQPLVYSKYELKNLSEIAGSSVLVESGFDASRAMLEKTDFSKYTVLHFATHGLLNQKNPEQSGFYLSTVDASGHDQDGFITMEDVYNLRVPVALVVLSACRTGLGKEVRGEGLIGLTRGFMHAGASSVVASLWKVDDEATSELMKYFYTNMLKKGMRPAAALRDAQNTLRQNPQNPQWQSPHYWAAFTLQGEFKEPIRLPRTTTASAAVQNAVGGALLFTLLAGIGWGFWRRRKV